MQNNFMVQLALAEVSSFEGRNRTVYKIYAEMLQICRTPQNKTRVMYKTNTSYAALTKHLQALQKSGLLQQEPFNKNRFRTTERGQMFIEKYYEILQLLDENYLEVIDRKASMSRVIYWQVFFLKATQEFERLMAERKCSPTSTEELWKWYDYSTKKGAASF